MISFDRVANAHESYNFHEPLSYPTGSSTLPSLGGEGTAACAFQHLRKSVGTSMENMHTDVGV